MSLAKKFLENRFDEAKSGELLTHESHKFNKFAVVKSARYERENGSPEGEDAYVVRTTVKLRDTKGFSNTTSKDGSDAHFIEMFVVTSSSDSDEIKRLKGSYKWPIYSGESDPITKAKKEAEKLVKKL